jgi:acetoin utilization deacetylase AcuC-like enzyme
MKLIFHEKFLESYDRDPAAEEGRLDKAFKLLSSKYPFVEPLPASKNDILLVHTVDYVDKVVTIQQDRIRRPGPRIWSGVTVKAGRYPFPSFRQKPESSAVILSYAGCGEQLLIF